MPSATSAMRALGDFHKAIEYHDEALALSREIGDRQGEGNHLGGLGIAYAAGRLPQGDRVP